MCYDDNHITIDGDTKLSFTEGKCLTHFFDNSERQILLLYAHCVLLSSVLSDVNKRYEAYGWHVQTVADVNDLQAVREAIAAAKAETGRPSMIKVYQN